MSDKLLLLDEPSLGLAPKLAQKIFETLANIAKEGTNIFSRTKRLSRPKTS